MLKPLILYHAGCADGFCAAWLMSKAFPEGEFQPVQYGEDPPDVKDRDVYILDFSYKRPVLERMHGDAKSLVVLDHHKTAEEDLRGLEYCTFDMHKSGARLTWEYMEQCLQPDFFLRKVDGGAVRPWLVDFTEDRDLWKWQLPDSKQVNAAIRSYPFDFALWDQLHLKESPKSLATEGQAILRYKEQLVAQHIQHASEVEIDGHKILSVNCSAGDLQSEVAGTLAEGRPFGMVWVETETNERLYSLRSREGGVDVSAIARDHGGGGHARAAGFRAPATGATGTFSQGHLNEQDEGDIKMAVAADPEKGVVIIDFGKPVAWLSLPKAEAQAVCRLIASKAQQLS